MYQLLSIKLVLKKKKYGLPIWFRANKKYLYVPVHCDVLFDDGFRSRVSSNPDPFP